MKKSLVTVCGVMLCFGLAVAAAQAQTSAVSDRERRAQFCYAPTPEAVHTYYLGNASLPNDGNEIQTALRNLLPPESKIYFTPSQNAILVCGAPDLQAVAAKVIHDLDRPRKGYRVTYTFTELENGKRVGTQHYSLVVSNGQRVSVKQGSRVPLATGSAGATPGTSQTQYQYVDVGMSFDVTFTETAGGGLLKTKVEQSSLAEDRSSVGAQDPILRQSTYEGSPVMVLGRPAMLSSLDIPNSTRHVDVEVMVEEVK